MGKISRFLFGWIWVGSFFLVSCSVLIPPPQNTPTPFLPSQGVLPEQTVPPVVDISVWFDPSVPDSLKSSFHLSSPFFTVSSQQEARLTLLPSREGEVGSRWIYAIVAAFPTIQDDISWVDFGDLWKGDQVGNNASSKILISQASLSAIENILGSPADGVTEIAPQDEIVDRLWADRNSLAIVPFEDLQPRMKVLSIDKNSPIDKTFDNNSYPLIVRFGLSGDAVLLASLQTSGIPIMPSSNRDPQKLTVVTMTGTTALVRAIAYKMETKGITYPGEKIKEILGQTDFLDVSNEISFTPDCPDPNPNSGSLNFCSKPEYIQLLEYVGVNIVELTGNHLLDYNAAPMYGTLDMYAQRGWGTFGGGQDAQTAKQPLLRENNGNRIAWIGCNVVGPEVDWATDYWPGTAKCDFEWEVSEIQRLKSEGYIVIATLQDQELYVPNPEPYIREHFLTLAAAGADIVQGSQAHFPQSFEFFQGGNTLIHYGLGNLFFDQMDNIVLPGIQREFIDRHILYNGKYISTELITSMLEDFSQPRLMTPEERSTFLQEYFADSGW